jgi:carbon storage regulator
MLVLTRRSRQSIMIGDGIELTILSVSGEKVRIGIDAPEDVPIFRKEVYLRIKGEDATSPEDATSRVTGELQQLAGSRGVP